MVAEMLKFPRKEEGKKEKEMESKGKEEKTMKKGMEREGKETRRVRKWG